MRKYFTFGWRVDKGGQNREPPIGERPPPPKAHSLLQALPWIYWQPMKDAPRKDEKHVLLFTTDHGIVEAWFAPGKWTEHPEYGREWSGPAWICADDAFQIEVEAHGYLSGHGYLFFDGTAKAWAEISNLPDPALYKDEI